MNMKLKLACGAAIFSAMALCASQASAQITSTGPNADEDLFLCFYASGNPGSTVNLEVDLGNFASPATSTNIDQDLINTFGSSWATRTDLTWAVIGANEQNINTDQASNELWIGSTGSALRNSTLTSQGTIADDIENMYSSVTAGTQGVNNNAFTLTNTESGSYGTPTQGTMFDIGQLFGQSNTNETADVGSGSDSLSLYQLAPSGESGYTAGSTDIGTFTLSSSGVVSYAAVPEPSTWASIALGAFALVGFRGFRRRNA